MCVCNTKFNDFMDVSENGWISHIVMKMLNADVTHFCIYISLIMSCHFILVITPLLVPKNPHNVSYLHPLSTLAWSHVAHHPATWEAWREKQRARNQVERQGPQRRENQWFHCISKGNHRHFLWKYNEIIDFHDFSPFSTLRSTYLEF